MDADADADESREVPRRGARRRGMMLMSWVRWSCSEEPGGWEARRRALFDGRWETEER